VTVYVTHYYCILIFCFSRVAYDSLVIKLSDNKICTTIEETLAKTWKTFFIIFLCKKEKVWVMFLSVNKLQLLLSFQCVVAKQLGQAAFWQF